MAKFAVFGLGFMGRTHLATLAGRQDVQVAAVCDTDPDRLSGPLGAGGGNLDTGGKAWDDLGVRRCSAPEEILADGDIDAVVVAVPSYLHADMTMAALKSRKHVFCEKPMALSVEDCDRMIAAAREAERVLMIGHCIRFWSEYAAAADLVRSGQYGRLRSLVMSRRSGMPTFGARGWFSDHAKSGGALLDLHVHDVDYALFLLGKPQGVRAKGHVGESGGIDHVLAWYDYGREGPIVEAEGSWIGGRSAPFVMSFRMYLERATVDYSSDRERPLRLYADDPVGLEVAPVNAYQAEMDHFIRCVNLRMDSDIVPPESSRQAVALALAEAKSIRTGRPIEID